MLPAAANGWVKSQEGQQQQQGGGGGEGGGVVCDLNDKFAPTAGLCFQFTNGKLMVPISVG